MRTFTQRRRAPLAPKPASCPEMKERPKESKPFLKREGCEARQQFGQRILGPPSDWVGPVPPRGSEVFIGNLPRDLYEDELIPVMESVGVVYLVRLMMDFTGTTRGFAFVTFADPEAAHRATSMLNRLEIRPGRFMGVYQSFDNRRLFLGNIPKTSTREEVMRQVKQHTEGVLDVTVHVNQKDPMKNRGYAFVRYESHRAAAIARRKLLEINGQLSKLYPRVTVDWAEPEVEDMNAVLHDVRVLYMRNLALCTTEDDIRKLCSNIVTGVERVKKQKDYAFVHFASREQAEAVKASLNGHILHGCDLEITWAKPVKNREEYQQRKAIARSMVSAGQARTGYLPHITPAGEPLIVMPQVRRAAGAQGLQHQARSGSSRSRNVDTSIMGIQSPTMFIPQMKNQSEVMISGFPAGTAHFQSERMASSPDEVQNLAATDAVLKQFGMLQTPVRNQTANARLLQNGQAYRGTALTPQYYMAPHMNMTPIITPSIATPTPQNMAVTPGTYLVPSPTLTGYESLNPYTLQNAYYQHALMGQQAGIATLERPRYSATE
ncbi:probable RNA-binding protein 46 isoform X2 [Penaeus japonicus]|uniref:probable RNA-binding protein 46 isoform X2 n=1 Tax=Penaeus japonicus TaxID=27405 RepID=UPI001C710709|nr:probable RNA-binding protein 46 isoform X2 [Penaeus japonicus]